MFKRLLVILVCLSFLFGFAVSAAFADEGTGRYGREDMPGWTYMKTASADGALVSTPCYLYSVTVYASSSNAHADIYDLTATPASAPGKVIELGQATQYSSTQEVYDPPIKMDNGVWTDLTSGVVIVRYR